MSGFRFSPPALEGLPAQPLGDKTLKDIVAAEVGYDGGTEFERITFTFDAGVNGLVRVCNSADDEDEEDGVLGLAPREEGDDDDGVLRLAPPLAFDPESAWLKYRVKAFAKGSVGAKFSAAALKVEGEKGVVFADYRRHGRGESAAEAVLADLPALRAPFSADDAVSLPEGDALFYRVYGELSAGLTLDWSDVFTAGLTRLSGLLRAGEVIALRVSPSASVSFHVGLRDDFRLVFTKGGPVGDTAETVRVSVLKSKSRELGVGAKLGVVAEFADPGAVEGVLSNVYEGLAGPLVGDVDALFAEAERAASLEALPAELQEPARALMSRLGLDPAADTLGELKEKWESLKSQVPGIIEQVAKTKVELGFTYEYLRVRTDDTLLQADLDAETFRRFHPDLLVCSLEGLTGWLRDNEAGLKKYLRRQSVKRTKTWGFNLGISPFGFKAGGRDKLETSRVIQENIRGGQRVAYDGLRSYEGEWNGDKVTFAADFKAEMQNFSTDGPAKTCEFEYGLSLNWQWDEGALGRDEFLNVLDHAQLWQVVSARRVEQALKQFEARFGQGAKVQMELTADHAALVGLLPLLVNPPAPPFNPPRGYSGFDADGRLECWGAEALAASMPYMGQFDGRDQPARRKNLYAPLWRRYFREDSLSFGEYRDIAFQNIPRLADDLKLELRNDEGLAAHERVKEMRQSTFAGMIELHQGSGGGASGVHRNWQNFARGLKSLEAAARPGNCLPHELIEKSFDDMALFFGQSLYLRAVGFYVAEVARLTGGARHLRRTLTVTYGEDETVTFGS
jgi:hypothetical protein